MNRQELEEQLQDLIDGSLAKEDRQHLLTRAQEDPEILELYCQHAELEAAFQRMSSSQAALGEEQTLMARDSRKRSQRRNLRLTIVAAAAILILVGVVLRLTFVREQPPMLALRSAPGTVVDISHALTDEDEPAQGTLVEGSRAVLSQGTVELNFGTGVRAIVRAPADLTLSDENKLYLAKGVAWFHVPEKAVGFQVRTPELTVVDLGTEFGIHSYPDSVNEVHVFDGEVEVRTHRGLTKTEVLEANEARSATWIGTLKTIAPNPDLFLDRLPSGLPYLHWAFDEREPGRSVAGGTHPASGREQSELIARSPVERFATVEGKFGKALFTPKEVAFAESALPGIAGNAPRTIAHWIKLPPIEKTEIGQPIIGWGSHTPNPFNRSPAFLSYVRSTKEGAFMGISFGGSFFPIGVTPIADNKWHHFAAVYTGQTKPNGEPELLCYLDGQPEPMRPRSDRPRPTTRKNEIIVDTTIDTPKAIPVTLFPQGWSTGIRKTNFPLAIDELYIFEAALTEEMVRNLYLYNRYNY